MVKSKSVAYLGSSKISKSVADHLVERSRVGSAGACSKAAIADCSDTLSEAVAAAIVLERCDAGDSESSTIAGLGVKNKFRYSGNFIELTIYYISHQRKVMKE